ncbi:FMN-binding negative transcriptional regulator [Luteimonas deserti]|uniref:FMN-binding negative transcriptional regulator n=1 Tax=Luteimonas deserti TaxID=2752306 RepID=A0A7Z0U046_9GAMM|nr:FMN-binding negative transcriptional regulator [Luteimonas deserti]NYZ64087.1 FMN-binding negative transcriptional regulator [Luteimonas deserti]
MATPAAFTGNDAAQIDALLEAHPFVTVVTVRDDAPDASHLPVLARRDSVGLLLEGHWARANPQAHHGESALVLVHGPSAYLSADWYPDKHERARVPTWNYVVAQLRGRFERIGDDAALGDLVARTAAHFEPRVGGDWRYDHDDPRERHQLRGIVGFRFRVESAAITRKLSQNHPVANRLAVIAALEARPGEAAHAIAAQMRDGLSCPPDPEP